MASTQHALRTSRASLRFAKQPKTQFTNSPKYKYKVPKVRVSWNTSFLRTSMYKNAFQASEVLQLYFKAYLQDLPSRFFFYDLLNSRKQRIHTDELCTRATFTCPQPRIPFFCSRVAGFTSDPSRLKYWLLHGLFYKETICKGSTGNGLLYAAKAVP